MNKLHIQLYATREGGRVRRAHILPFHGSYDVAQHTYGALSLLLLLHPKPSTELIKAVAWHDVGERWFGDMPSPAKTANPKLAEEYERLESAALKTLGLAQELNEREEEWLKAVDILDLWLWCREERKAGNENVDEWLNNCAAALSARILEGTLPNPVVRLYNQLSKVKHARLSDYFHYVELEILAQEPAPAPPPTEVPAAESAPTPAPGGPAEALG